MAKDREMSDAERKLLVPTGKEVGLGPYRYEERPKRGKGTVFITDSPFGGSLYDRAPTKSG